MSAQVDVKDSWNHSVAFETLYTEQKHCVICHKNFKNDDRVLVGKKIKGLGCEHIFHGSCLQYTTNGACPPCTLHQDLRDRKSWEETKAGLLGSILTIAVIAGIIGGMVYFTPVKK